MKKDEARKLTDDMLFSLEIRLSREYSRAEEEVEEKLNNYLEAFARKDADKRAKLAAGEITKQEYNYWRTGQIMMGKRWQEMKDTLAQDFHNTNEIAKSITQGYMPEVYALNHNYGTFEIEKASGVDTSYTLYNRDTVEWLMREDPDLLPPVGEKMAARIAAGKDIRWNKQMIQSVMLQSILQGESIPNIAKRLASRVGDSNKASAVRNARTMTTRAENAGKYNSFKRAQGMGIKTKKQWIAVLDGRTRDSHRELDGEVKDIDKPFSNGLMYPGAEGPPQEVYNCRCGMISVLKGFEIDHTNLALRDNKLGDMTYQEWKNEHKKKQNTQSQNNIQPTTKKAQKQANKVANSTFKPSKAACANDMVAQKMEAEKVHYLTPKQMKNIPTTEEIVKKIGGLDRTQGSCSSLAFTYAANKGGWNVRDFRGGASRKTLATMDYIDHIGQLANGKLTRVSHQITEFNKYIKKNIEEGKEYYFCIARHAAIVTNQGGELKYLELQNREDRNGWKRLDDEALRERFSAKKTSKYVSNSWLIDVDDLKNNEAFLNLMGYVNTVDELQLKGAGGGIK